jgi:hypothetical protein
METPSQNQISCRRCDFLSSLTARLKLKGIAWSVALPFGWLLMFYGLAFHVWFTLGRWPRFGESLEGLLRFHERAVWMLIPLFYFSLYAAGLVFLVCLFLRGWRHRAVYALSYSAAVVLAGVAASFLAPRPFLNWFLD